MNAEETLVSVYQSATTTEAYLMKNLLEDHGIESQVTEQNEPFVGLSTAAHDLLVRGDDEELARAIVQRQEEIQQQRVAQPDWKCPWCGQQMPGDVDECECCGGPADAV